MKKVIKLTCFLLSFSHLLAVDDQDFGKMAFAIAGEYKKHGFVTQWANELCQKISNMKLENENQRLSYDVLLKHSISTQELDAIAYEWCTRSKELSLVFLPISTDSRKPSGDCTILYKKRITMLQQGFDYLIPRLLEVAIRGNLAGSFSSAFDVYLLRLLPKNDFGIVTKHLINDCSFLVTGDRLIDLAQIIFNGNTIHFINNRKIVESDMFQQWFQSFNYLVSKCHLKKDELCIDGGAVLAIYGLRNIGTDFDFIVHNPQNFKNRPANMVCPKYIDLHNSWWHHKNVDDIIFNPFNHFYYKGFKIASLPAMREFKVRRNWKKDKEDVRLINQVL